MFFFAILIGILILLYVNHKCSFLRTPPPEPPVDNTPKMTSYGYGEHTFRTSSYREAQVIMDYFDRADEEKRKLKALRNLEHCHIWNELRKQCCCCGITRSEYYSKPYYEQERCPNVKYEDFVVYWKNKTGESI